MNQSDFGRSQPRKLHILCFKVYCIILNNNKEQPALTAAKSHYEPRWKLYVIYVYVTAGQGHYITQVWAIRCVAACRCCHRYTQTPALHRSSGTSNFHESRWLPGFLFPWLHCSLMQQNPETLLGVLAWYQPRERDSEKGWHTDWLTDWHLQPATVPAELTICTTLPSFQKHSLAIHSSGQ